MKNNLTIGVTTISFSKNKKLMNELKNYKFKKILYNKKGKRFDKNELIKFLSKCDVAIIGLDKIDETILSKTPKLKAIAKFGVGLDNINFQACKRYNVKILHTDGVNKRSVAELTLGYMLCLSRNIHTTSNLLKREVWQKAGGSLLSGKTIGIIGVGNIGKEVVKLLKPFDCKILANDIIEQNDYYKQNHIKPASKKKIYKNADFITIHTPLTDKTKALVNKEVLKKMKKNAFLINTARGEIVKTNDLKWALKNHIIAGAALDVYENEPPTDKEFIKLPNLINTPHIGGNAKEAVLAMGMSAINNIIKWIKENKC